MMSLLDGKRIKHPPFAPPFLKSGKLVMAQTANILLFLGSRHHLAPQGEAGQLWTHQLQLTLADFVVEIHDTRRLTEQVRLTSSSPLALACRGSSH
jgi:glutathione S-transferase